MVIAWKIKWLILKPQLIPLEAFGFKMVMKGKFKWWGWRVEQKIKRVCSYITHPITMIKYGRRYNGMVKHNK